MSAELRDEAADGAASRALFGEYMALVRERLGAGFVPSERIFACEDAFEAPGAAWLVAYEDGRPVGCAGLRPLDARTAEIKRMFVTAPARGRGHGRLLLRELERRAAAGGRHRVRLLSTEVLAEALALYEAEGYEVVEHVGRPGHPLEIWLEKALHS
jgi:GNAT superfamily N-acetyltransferase